MNILVFGNSHAACVIEAARGSDAAGPHRVDFLAIGGSGPKGTDYTVEGPCLSVTSERLRAFQARLGQPLAFDLSEYQAVMTVGAEVSPFKLLQIIGRYHVLDWERSNPGDLPTLTEACLGVALHDSIELSTAMQFLDRLNAASALRGQVCGVLCQPAPSERILQRRAQSAAIRRAMRIGIDARARQAFEAACGASAAARGATFLPQQPETLVGGLLTAERFNEGARRLYNLDHRQPGEDLLHANAAYGALMLAQIRALAEKDRG